MKWQWMAEYQGIAKNGGILIFQELIMQKQKKADDMK